MECNRDQSDDCYNMAIKFLRDGNTERAVHFLEKSIKLYPNPRAQHLLSQIQAEQQQQNQHQQSQSFDENTNTDSFSSSGSGSGSSSSSRTQSRQSASTPVDTSDIEDPDIKRILEAGDDYYMVFDLPKTATIVEIKKRYRKLAIKTHPDKSTSKGAEEAFKKLGQAYGCLSDEEKRKFYDLNGFDSSQPRTPSAQAQQSFYRRRGFTFQDEDEIDPDELFRFFFGGGPFYQPGGRTRVYRFRPQYTQRRYQRNGEDEDDSGNRWGRTGHSPLFGLAMFIGFVLLMNIISGKLSEHQTQEAKYSFNPSPRFNVKRNSEIFNVDYYVPSSMFSSKNSKNVKDGTSSKILKDIDFEVDQQYLASLERHARYYGGRSGYYNEYLEAREKMRLWRERKVKSQSDTKFSFEADGEFVERRVSSVFQVEYYVKPSSDSEAPGEGTSNLKEINDIDLDVDKYYLNTLKKDTPVKYKDALKKFNEWNNRVRNR